VDAEELHSSDPCLVPQ